MSDLFERIGSIGVVPVISIEDAEHAVPLADALLEGGLPIAEITFRTRAAAEVMRVLRDKRPDLLIGGGTILDRPSLHAAKACGAAFGLAPGYDPDIVANGGRDRHAFRAGHHDPERAWRRHEARCPALQVLSRRYSGRP